MPDIFVAPKEKTEPKAEPVEPATEQRGGSLSAFVLNPDNVRFETQSEDEQVILLLRKHWITNLPWLFVIGLLLLCPTLFFPIFARTGTLAFLPAHYWLIMTIGWYLLTFSFALVNFIVWYFNVYIITNERVIDVDFYHLLYKKLSSTRISRIQDVTYNLGGVIRSLLDFGDVFIQTAGTETNFEFLAVPHPEMVVRKIGELIDQQEENPV